jgi:phosphoribosyl 1,2-cyclic phosphodiesterase
MRISPYMKGATYYVIESNHDYKMLLHSHRPASLKHRIHSDVGHLSNSDSAHYMVDLDHPRPPKRFIWLI